MNYLYIFLFIYLLSQVSARCVEDRNNDICWKDHKVQKNDLADGWRLQTYFIHNEVTDTYISALPVNGSFIGGIIYTENKMMSVNLNTAPITNTKGDQAYFGTYELNHDVSPTQVTHHIESTNIDAVAANPTQIRNVRLSNDGEFLELSFKYATSPTMLQILTFKRG